MNKGKRKAYIEVEGGAGVGGEDHGPDARLVWVHLELVHQVHHVLLHDRESLPADAARRVDSQNQVQHPGTTWDNIENFLPARVHGVMM